MIRNVNNKLNIKIFKDLLSIIIIFTLLSFSSIGEISSYAAGTPYTYTYYYTGSDQAWAVPQGVYKVKIECWGAVGGGWGAYSYSGSSYNLGGKGGYTSAEFDVMPGQILYIYVGGSGITHAGFNGGGRPILRYDYESGRTYEEGAYGGGASDVRTSGGTWNNPTGLSNRIIVAGGGGGAGAVIYYYSANNIGGHGGGLTGGTGQYRQWDPVAVPGKGGTQTAGGAGGYTRANTGNPGGFGYGGDASSSSSSQNGRNQSGGGGGWYGGGAGGGQYASDVYDTSSKDWYTGAGGGSSYVSPAGKNVVMQQGVNTGNPGDGKVAITTIPTAPPAPTISTTPTATTYGSVTATITYSADSDTKEYRINSGSWQSYTSPITITDNCLIEARASNSVGTSPPSPASTKNITNIVPGCPVVTGSSGVVSWSNTAGRGYVTLSWPAVTGATGYKIYVFDGDAYRGFDIGNVTSWDSRTAKIYPSESILDSYADNSKGDIFNHNKTGLDLRDNPNKLYKKTYGTVYDISTNYWFWVAPYNSYGENATYSHQADPRSRYIVTLDNRTDTVAPTCSVEINSNAEYSKDPIVTLKITAEESASGLSEVLVSNDGLDWRPVSLNNSTTQWTLPNGDGAKTVRVKVKDAAGNESAEARDDIVLDTIGPSGELKINEGIGITNQPVVTLYFTKLFEYANVNEVKISNNFDFSTKQVYKWSELKPVDPNNAILENWALDPSKEGSKTVYVMYTDWAGNNNSVEIKGTIDYFTSTSDIPEQVFDSITNNQIIDVNGTEIELKTPAEAAEGYTTPNSSLLNANNKLRNRGSSKYRINFDVKNSNIVQDVEAILRLNDYNEDSVNIVITDISLKKKVNNSFVVIKDLNEDYIRLGINVYKVVLGKDNNGIPIILANGDCSYAIDYTVIAYIGKDSSNTTETQASIINECIIKSYVNNYIELTEPDTLSHRKTIETLITR